MRLIVAVTACTVFSTLLWAQPDRVRGPVDIGRTVALRGHLHPLALPQFDEGPVEPSTKLGMVTLALAKSAAQQAALDRLLEEQQDTASPNYHRWLTPEQYAGRFGVSPSDAGKVAAWLRSEGLAVEATARSRAWIAFSGTAAQVENALHTRIHRYRVEGAEHFAPAVEPSVPAALEPVVAGFHGLDDFDPSPPRPFPLDTLSNGLHGVSPDDFATIYNLAPLYSQGIDGTGQTIVVAGQVNLNPADIETFRSYFNLPKNDPQLVLFGPDPGPGSGLSEAILDVAWAGAVARKATIVYVYATSVFVSVAYAVDQNLAPVISLSYGGCEERQSGSVPLLFRNLAQQANAEGITWLAGSGDSGAAGCEVPFVNPLATRGLAADFPASIPEVTAVGGTEFSEGGGSYWAASNTANHASALSYIPEVAWNDTIALSVVAATGGGASELYPKPAWQAGPGVPNDNVRDTPDISMAASFAHDGYVLPKGGLLYFVGGTSVSTPAFAGVLALLNQYVTGNGVQAQAGLGNINPALYRMAQSTPAAFHDITSGDNMTPCAAGTKDCANGQFGYTAGAGYDLATGLGSIDVFSFITNWNTAGFLTTTSVSANSPVLLSGALQLVATVTSAVANVTPTGTVYFNLGTKLLGSAPLSGTSKIAGATLVVSAGQLTLGSDIITATYSGDARVGGSWGSVPVDVSLPTANSAVVPAVTPNPIYQQPPDANGYTFFYTVSLTEMAGIGTTLTGFTIDGVNETVSSFFSNPAIPPNGTISANIGSKNFSVPRTRAYVFTGLDANGFQWSQEVDAQFYGSNLPVMIGGITNNASGQQIYAPGMELAVYGADLAADTVVAQSLPLPFTLSNTTATVNGVPAPFYFVSPGQIDLQIPYETQPGNAVLEITNGSLSDSFSFRVDPTAPGIFTDSKNNTVPFASGSRGQVLTLFITGEGQVSPPLATGATPAPTTPVSQLPAPVANVTMTIGNLPAPIQFTGIISGVAGVLQINFTVSANAPAGPQPVVVTVGGVASAPAAFTVQ